MISIYTSTCITKCDESCSYQMYVLERVKLRGEKRLISILKWSKTRGQRKSVPRQRWRKTDTHNRRRTKTKVLSIYILLVKKKSSMDCGMQQLYGIGCVLYEMKEIAQNKWWMGVSWGFVVNAKREWEEKRVVRGRSRSEVSHEEGYKYAESEPKHQVRLQASNRERLARKGPSRTAGIIEQSIWILRSSTP